MSTLEPWLIVEIKRAHFADPQSLEAYLEPLFSGVGSWIPANRRLALLSMEESEFLPTIQDYFEPGNVLIQPEGWGNAAALLVLLLDIEARDREGRLIHLLAKPERDPGLVAEDISQAFLHSLMNPQSILVAGARSSLSSASELGLSCGGVGIYLLSYMLAQPEMVQPFLRHGRRISTTGTPLEIDAEASTLSLGGDIFGENLSLLRWLELAETGFNELRFGLDPAVRFAPIGMPSTALH